MTREEQYFSPHKAKHMTEVKINDKITLYNADCMEVMAMYPNGYFDLALIDPPYRDDKDCKGLLELREINKAHLRSEDDRRRSIGKS